MAFDKDPEVLNSVGTWRQVGRQFANRRTEKKSGGGGAPYFVNQYRPSTTDLDTIRVIEGKYPVEEADVRGNITTTTLPFMSYTDHYDGRTSRSCICSAGPGNLPRDKRRPCLACDIFWSSMTTGADGKKKRGRMSKSEKFAFTVVDQGPYHKAAQLDRDGNVRRNNSGEPYMHWVKCTGRGCEECKSGAETRPGDRRHWSLGINHYNTLLEFDKLIGQSCRVCGSKNTIQSVAWICANHGCGDAVVDMTDTTLTQKQIDETVQDPVKCRSCGHEGFLQEIIECVNCTPAGREPKRATIFDVDLTLKRVEDPSGKSQQTSLIISSWSDPRPIDKRFADMAKPLELEKTFAPTSLERQSELFSVPLEREPVTSGSRSYSK